jgi:hypothetical protein
MVVEVEVLVVVGREVRHKKKSWSGRRRLGLPSDAVEPSYDYGSAHAPMAPMAYDAMA